MCGIEFGSMEVTSGIPAVWSRSGSPLRSHTGQRLNVRHDARTFDVVKERASSSLVPSLTILILSIESHYIKFISNDHPN
jgi:hypothetical protein